MYHIESDSFDIHKFETDDWEAFLESTENDWNPTGIIESLDLETQQLLNSF